jgi:hypothetical protein
MLDYPHVRASDVCPLCKRNKDRGLIACWPCYHALGMRYGKKDAEALIEQTEAGLSKVAERSAGDFNSER